ncbi:MAG: TetR/AcrR family transcriptional regulator [Candidatus Competibacteraceae bacterium]|nr:TetR/AcrR family transcriptional regulator [Candidatus Competibacteraceae bacterium]
MIDALRRKGLHGVGLAEVVARAQAPKGVLYHHFPGGKTELAVAAVNAVVEYQRSSLEEAMRPPADPVAALKTWLAGAQGQLAQGNYEHGCPLATIALESTAQDTLIREALARGFAVLRAQLAQGFEKTGVDSRRAEGLAALLVSAYEGGLLQARVAGSLEPMQQMGESLFDLITQQLEREQS